VPVEALREVAGREGCSVGQLCLAWLLKRGEGVFPPFRELRYSVSLIVWWGCC
jgi:hypothetical protein